LILGSVTSASSSTVNAECKSTSTLNYGGVTNACDGGVMIQVGSQSNDESVSAGSGAFGDLKTEHEFYQNVQKFTFGSQAKLQSPFFGSNPFTSGQFQPGIDQLQVVSILHLLVGKVNSNPVLDQSLQPSVQFNQVSTKL
jgi:hypothetical protein